MSNLELSPRRESEAMEAAAARTIYHHAHQFETIDQQYVSDLMGMWLFLASEVLFFGGIFAAYIIYRSCYPEVFNVAGKHTLIEIGTLNSVILIASSFTMSLAVRAAELRYRSQLFWMLILTVVLGCMFFGFKCYEYSQEFAEGLWPGASFHIEGTDPSKAKMFYYLYFLMTGVHMLHLTIGIVILLVFAILAKWKNAFIPHAIPVHIVAIYWYFIDVVWVFLFPLIYLVNRHG